jgi:hypothetical protein
VLGRYCRGIARALPVALIALGSVTTGAMAEEVGGYARCGADYVEIPAYLGHPDEWGFAQRDETQERLGDAYTPEEIDFATADDAAFEEKALADGLFVVDCADVLLRSDGEWEYFEDSFMD